LKNEIRTCRLIGFDADTNKQLFDFPNYALRHSLSGPTLDVEGTVLIVNEVSLEIVKAREDGDTVFVDVRKANISN
jgi:hypothetical protein